MRCSIVRIRMLCEQKSVGNRYQACILQKKACNFPIVFIILLHQAIPCARHGYMITHGNSLCIVGISDAPSRLMQLC